MDGERLTLQMAFNDGTITRDQLVILAREHGYQPAIDQLLTTIPVPVAAWLVTEVLDYETSTEHGLFSKPEKAKGYIERTAQGGIRWHKSGMSGREKQGPASWYIDPFTVDDKDEEMAALWNLARDLTGGRWPETQS